MQTNNDRITTHNTCNSTNCCLFKTKCGGYSNDNIYYCSYKCYRSNLIRQEWAIGNKVLIFSVSYKKWFDGIVIDIINDTMGEWLKVTYNNNMLTKEISRNDTYIMPFISKPSHRSKHKTHIAEYTQWTNKYKLLHKLGSGAEGIIYSIKQNNDNTNKVVKIYRLTRNYENKIEKIQKEYKILKQINNGIYLSLNYGPSPNVIYLTMEKLQEVNIEKININKFIIETASKLQLLHEKYGYVHFDINTQNIMYHKNKNEYIIIDGGLMKKLNKANKTTNICGYVGKFGFIPPEMHWDASIKNEVNEKCDVFSLGLTILDIITCQNVFIYRFAKQVQQTNATITIGSKEELKFYYDYAIMAHNNNGIGDEFMKTYLDFLLGKKLIAEYLHKLLSQMLTYNPLKRPSMAQIVKTIKKNC